MKYFDSHAHLDMEPLSQDREGAIERAANAGVTKIINVGATLRGSQKSVDIANEYPNIWASVGLHPHDAETMFDLVDTIEQLRLLAQNDKVVAVGEIGLDYFSDSNNQLKENEKEKQKALFIAQLDLADELNLPIILHVRDAWEDTLSIIRKSKIVNRKSSKAPGVVHCFTGTPDQAKKFIDLGFYVGFTGFITFEQSKFDSIRESVKMAPMEKILIETDAPFLSPEPYRGKVNEPAYVILVAKKIAELKNIPLDEVARITAKNTQSLFNL